MIKRLVVLATAVVLGVVPLVACGGSNTTAPTPTTSATSQSTQTTPSPTAAATSQTTEGQISGTWNGTSASDNHPERNSSFTVVFSQDGNTISGPITISGGCISEGTVNGTLSGQTIEFGVIESTGIDFTGTISGNSMSGTFKTAPPCGPDNDTGTWEATR
jgi:hypothetical protein